MALDSEQRAIARSAIAAAAIAVAMLGAAGQLGWIEANDIDQRLSIFAIAVAAPILGLFRDVARLGNHRFAEPLDRNAAAADTKTPKAELLSAILRNTHEQATLAGLVYLSAALLLPDYWIDAILGCAVLFIVGRIFFAANYAKGAGGRAFGFGLTFYPTMMLAILTAITALI
jgi:MAPEG family